MNDFTPEDLSHALVRWMRQRGAIREWPYHPRKTDVSDFIRRKFIADLLAASPRFGEHAREGRIACDLNVSLSTPGGRTRKLDLIVGRPLDGTHVPPTAAADPLRKAKVAAPLLTIEVKLCMTEHRKATSRLIDELHASLEVVKAVKPSAVCVAVVVVNVGERFTSPLNLPGPNRHDRPVEIQRLIAKVLARVPVGGAKAYDCLNVTVVDVDNETRFEVPPAPYDVPPERSYASTVSRAVEAYERAAMAGALGEQALRPRPRILRDPPSPGPRPTRPRSGCSVCRGRRAELAGRHPRRTRAAFRAGRSAHK